MCSTLKHLNRFIGTFDFNNKFRIVYISDHLSKFEERRTLCSSINNFYLRQFCQRLCHQSFPYVWLLVCLQNNSKVESEQYFLIYLYVTVFLYLIGSKFYYDAINMKSQDLSMTSTYFVHLFFGILNFIFCQVNWRSFDQNPHNEKFTFVEYQLLQTRCVC